MSTEPSLDDMNRLVKFTLEKYGVKAKWKIIPLSPDEWKKFSTDRVSLDKLALNTQKQILDLLDKLGSSAVLEKGVKRRLLEGVDAEKDIRKE
jgi:hypothetical protein